MTPLGRAAANLAAKGMRVFPCKERGKEPMFKGWPAYATTDPQGISNWWREYNFNIGLATGGGSGVWVLDIDGDEGEEQLRELERKHGALPPTVEVITGKGRHLYWRWPTGLIIRNKQNNLVMPGIDVRGDGGYVLAPPSIHPSGRVYAWSVDSTDSFEDAPEWLLDLVVKGAPKEHQAATPEQWLSFIDSEADGSRRGAGIARLYGLLVRRHIPPEIALGIVRVFNEARCNPPLDPHDVEKIALEIAHREAEQVRNG
jgi:hypothetical protein